MSRAFTKEDESGDVLGGIGERPVSTHRNLVTPQGIAAMDREIASLREELAKGPDREKVALLSRDLRYWTARRETAELSVPEPGSDVVRFGMVVSLESEDGREARWRIVGEDEADAAHGSISHVSPMARALFGKGVGDVATVNGVEWEIVGLGA
ncbi:GreA/GreB family elongation factor [Mesorhizobium sp. RP14(2022)]|uniref:GreA/GreB family elongation factor n=1 Tax=Mesorhizobium liriopis TaxID=2953882 RepID=A0ABT1C2Z8_9HYPH|nr:GreA/GreB family elongation factor [Mesorhizobium liriopis]MCO6048605.1 GreA/GreB family elongation factor [Mesorhizobium liriopis]